MDNFNSQHDKLDPNQIQRDSDARIKLDMQAKREKRGYEYLDQMASVAQGASVSARVDVGETNCLAATPDPSQALVRSLEVRRDEYIREAENLNRHAKSNYEMAEKYGHAINILTLSPHKAILTEMLALLKSGVV